MKFRILPYALALGLCVSSAQAQEFAGPSVFFGFDYILEPLAVKWACGGERDADIERVEDLIRAFPEDASQAELAEIMVLLTKLPLEPASVSLILGSELPTEEIQKVCKAAAPLHANWLNPKTFGTPSVQMPEDQKTTLLEYFETLSQLYTLYPPR